MEHRGKAQIAFTDGKTWSVIGPYETTSGLCPMPAVDCPVVNYAGVDEEKLARRLRKYISPAGVSSTKNLIASLRKIGCVVTLHNGKRVIQSSLAFSKGGENAVVFDV